MSIVTQLLHPGQLFLLPLAAGDNGGLLDWVNTEANSAKTTIITIAGVVAVILILIRAWQSRGALSAILVAGITAAVFLWLISHISTVQDKVGKEFSDGTTTKGMPVLTQQVATEPDLLTT